MEKMWAYVKHLFQSIHRRIEYVASATWFSHLVWDAKIGIIYSRFNSFHFVLIPFLAHSIFCSFHFLPIPFLARSIFCSFHFLPILFLAHSIFCSFHFLNLWILLWNVSHLYKVSGPTEEGHFQLCSAYYWNLAGLSTWKCMDPSHFFTPLTPLGIRQQGLETKKTLKSPSVHTWLDKTAAKLHRLLKLSILFCWLCPEKTKPVDS